MKTILECLKVTGAAIGGFVAGITAAVPTGIYINKEDKLKKYSSKTLSHEMFTTSASLALIPMIVYGSMGWWAIPIVFAIKGDTKSALLWSIPYIVNAASTVGYGVYRLVKSAKEEVKEKQNKRAEKLETILTPEAENIETAIKSLSFSKGDSLIQNKITDEEKNRELYKQILTNIPRERLTQLRERLEGNLSALEMIEKRNPSAIKEYFDGTFGIPIRNYKDLNLFYEALLLKETE